MPKGIYSANENYDTHINIINKKAPLTAKEQFTAPTIDWELFAGLFYLSKYFIKGDHLDDAITNRGYSRNLKRYIDKTNDRCRRRARGRSGR